MRREVLRNLLLAGLVVVCAGCGKGAPSFMPTPRAKAIPAPPVAPVVEPPMIEEETPPVIDEPAPTVEGETDPATPASAETSGVLFADSFADVAGSIKRSLKDAENASKQSEGPANSRLVYTFMATPEEGSLTMRVHEDAATSGPDGEPGVLALTWEQIPRVLHYSGFVYLGSSAATARMTLPTLQQARTPGDLQGLRLKFRFRGLNPNSKLPAPLKVECRLEPQLQESFSKRLDLGMLEATDEWGVFDFPLAEGKNIEAFLLALAQEKVTAFKIVWGQAGPIAGYRAGDTLLIDDLAITSETSP